MRKSALVVFGLVVAILVALGLIVLSSASLGNAVRLHPGDEYFFMKRQFLYLAMGLVVATVAALVDYHIYLRHTWFTVAIFALVFLLLLAVFPPIGRPINGSCRWINLGFFNLQPSELAKCVIAISIAVLMTRLGWRVETVGYGLILPFIIIGVYVLPVICEPDFGSTVVIVAAGVLVMFVGGTRLKHLLFTVPPAVIAFGAYVAQNPNRMARISAWLGAKVSFGVQVADAATKNAEYQGNMAKVAIANGGLWGQGLNQSLQKQFFLPEAHTDMIFAVGAEEFGLVFSVTVFVLFLVFFAYTIYIAAHAQDRFGKLLVVGLSFIIFFAAIFNIAVVCGALPMKGMALPFFSYGGTNMIAAFFAVGTIFSVGLHSCRSSKRKTLHVR